MNDLEALDAVLDEHWFHPVSWRCSCGWVHPQYGAKTLDPKYIRFHIANSILIAGFRLTTTSRSTTLEDTSTSTERSTDG